MAEVSHLLRIVDVVAVSGYSFSLDRIAVSPEEGDPANTIIIGVEEALVSASDTSLRLSAPSLWGGRVLFEQVVPLFTPSYVRFAFRWWGTTNNKPEAAELFRLRILGEDALLRQVDLDLGQESPGAFGDNVEGVTTYDEVDPSVVLLILSAVVSGQFSTEVLSLLDSEYRVWLWQLQVTLVGQGVVEFPSVSVSERDGRVSFAY